MNRAQPNVLVATAVGTLVSLLVGDVRTQTTEEGFTSILDGRTLTNWHTMNTLGQPPGAWRARDRVPVW